jgi:hypothetical protein
MKRIFGFLLDEQQIFIEVAPADAKLIRCSPKTKEAAKPAARQEKKTVAVVLRFQFELKLKVLGV